MANRDLLVGIRQDNAKLRKSLNKAKSEFRRFAKNTKKDLAPIVSSFKAIRSAAVALAPALAGIGFGNAVAEQIRFADELGKTAKQLGGTVEFLSEATFAAEKYNITNQQLATGLQRMARRLAEAAVGTGEAQNALKELGLDAQELEKLTLDEKFTTILKALSGIEDEATSVRLAMKFFDSDGVKIARLADNFEELRLESRKLGGTITTEMAESAAKAADSFKNLDTAIDSLVREVLPPFANIATTVINKLLGIEQAANTLNFDTLLKEQRKIDAQIEKTFAEIQRLGAAQQENRVTFADSANGIGANITFTKEYTSEIIKLSKELEKLRIRQKEIDDEEAFRIGTGNLRGNRPTIGGSTLPNSADADEAKRKSEQAKKDADDLAASTAKAREEITAYNKSLLEGAALINRQFAEDKANLDAIAKQFPQFAIAAQNTARALREKADEEIRNLQENTEETLNSMSEFARQAARNMQDALAEFLFDPFENGLKGMLESFVTTLRRMAAQAAASRIFTSLGNQFPKYASFFGVEGKASGGPVSGNTPYIVGEKGPELFVPGASGAIVPNNKMASGVVKIINNISAPAGFDRQALSNMLDQRDETTKKEIIDMMQRGLIPA